MRNKGRESVKAEPRQQWQEEVNSGRDLGQYGHRHGELGYTDYVKGFGRGSSKGDVSKEIIG